MRRLLLRRAETVAVVVESPQLEQQQDLVAARFNIDNELASELVRRAARLLGDVANNPLMLLLGVRAILTGSDPNNAAHAFDTVVKSIGANNGYADVSVYQVGLGIAYTRLLNQGRRYCDSFTWSETLKAASDELGERGIDLTPRQLREFGSETGLIRITAHDIIRPLHDSFADYLSAVAISRSVAELPQQLVQQDRARIRYIAGLTGVNQFMSALVTRDLPFTAAAIAPMESRSPDESWLAETKLLLEHLLPASMPSPRLAYWQDSSGRTVVTVGGDLEGWWDGPIADGAAQSGRHFHS